DSDTSYAITMTRAAGVSVSNAAPQLVWLEFGGGSGIRLAGERPQDVPAFDAARINPVHKLGQDAIVDKFIAHMQTDYAPYNVVLLRSDRDERPTTAYSTLYLGGYSSIYLGLADSVDYYNA